VPALEHSVLIAGSVNKLLRPSTHRGKPPTKSKNKEKMKSKEKKRAMTFISIHVEKILRAGGEQQLWNCVASCRPVSEKKAIDHQWDGEWGEKNNTQKCRSGGTGNNLTPGSLFSVKFSQKVG